MMDSQEEAFQVWALLETQVEAQSMVESKAQYYAVAAATVTMSALLSNLITEEMVLVVEEEEGSTEIDCYPPFTTNFTPLPLP